MAKLLASEASWAAGNASARHSWRITGSPRSTTSSASCGRRGSTKVAPINNNLVLAFVAEKCLGLPKSY